MSLHDELHAMVTDVLDLVGQRLRSDEFAQTVNDAINLPALPEHVELTVIKSVLDAVADHIHEV